MISRTLAAPSLDSVPISWMLSFQNKSFTLLARTAHSRSHSFKLPCRERQEPDQQPNIIHVLSFTSSAFVKIGPGICNYVSSKPDSTSGC
nr:hypothetical protein CFP56_67342 [Quercus suber]